MKKTKKRIEMEAFADQLIEYANSIVKDPKAHSYLTFNDCLTLYFHWTEKQLVFRITYLQVSEGIYFKEEMESQIKKSIRKYIPLILKDEFKKFRVTKGSEHECCLDYSVKNDSGFTVCECPGQLEAEMICNALNLIAR